MVSGTTWVAIGLIAGLIVLGVAQHINIPRTSLAGAVTAPQTQEQINACMQGCMRGCVTIEGTEQNCTQNCDSRCVTKNP